MKSGELGLPGISPRSSGGRDYFVGYGKSYREGGALTVGCGLNQFLAYATLVLTRLGRKSGNIAKNSS